MEPEAASRAPKDVGDARPEFVEARLVIRVREPQRCAVSRPVDLVSPPRFGTRSLLLWIAGAAVALAAVRRLNPVEPGALGLLLVSGYAAGCGAAWTGLSLWIARALRGAQWPVEPGHWLLVALGARLALELAIRLGAPRAFAAPQAVLDAATCCALVLPLFSRSLSALWKGCFALLCFVTAWPLATVVLESYFFAIPKPLVAGSAWIERQQPWLVALVAIAFALADRRAWRARTWLHWTGLGVALWFAMAAALSR